MDGFLKLTGFAAKLGVSRETAANKIKNGEYPAIVVGRSYKIPESVIEVKKLQEAHGDKISPIVFLFGNNKGGATKTTSTINVGASLAFYGYRVLVVDMDTQSNASMMVKKDFKDNNITKLLYEMGDMSEEEIEKNVRSCIVPVPSSFITAGKFDLLPNSLSWDLKKEQLMFKPNPENMLERLLKDVKSDYDFVIIDTAPTMDVTWRMSVIASDSVIISLKAEQYSINGLGGVFERTYMLNGDYKDRKGKNIHVLGAVVSDYSKNTKISAINVPQIEKSLQQFSRYNVPVLMQPFISHSVKAFEQQTLSGPILFDEPGSNMSYEYLELSKNILYHLYSARSES